MSEIEREKYASYVKDRQEWLASTFRDLMTTAQSYKISNTYRKEFYDEVNRLADQVNCPDFRPSPLLREWLFFERRNAIIRTGQEKSSVVL